MIVHKPGNPLDFLIEKLDEEPLRRVFLMGPPGSFRQQINTLVGANMNWTTISTGDLLRAEVTRKTDLGKRIQDSFKNYRFVDDDIVIQLVSNQIKSCEEKRKSWIHLNVNPTASIARIKNNLIAINQGLYGPELEELAAQCLQEYNLNLKGVREAFNQFILDHNCTDGS